MNMAFKISSKTVHRLFKADILPRISGELIVRYAQKEYKVIGYVGEDDRERLILTDPQQSDCELIVEMDKVEPLLRKMKSMTIDEKERYQELLDGVTNQTTEVWEVTEWLNRKLFDYKDLIGKGLAEEK
jgi:hypothetical protein